VPQASSNHSAGLTSRPVTPLLPEYDQVKDLYRRAFPESEREPWWTLMGLSIHPGNAFRAWFDGEVLAGMTYTMASKTALLVLYLAVNDAVRSRGYGTRILSILRKIAGPRPLLVEIEPVDDDAPNAEQRRRRLAFYERAGLRLTGFTLQEGTECYSIMTSAGSFDPLAYQRLLSRAGLGLRPITVTRTRALPAPTTAPPRPRSQAGVRGRALEGARMSARHTARVSVCQAVEFRTCR